MQNEESSRPEPQKQVRPPLLERRSSQAGATLHPETTEENEDRLLNNCNHLHAIRTNQAVLELERTEVGGAGPLFDRSQQRDNRSGRRRRGSPDTSPRRDPEKHTGTRRPTTEENGTGSARKWSTGRGSPHSGPSGEGQLRKTPAIRTLGTGTSRRE